MHYLTQVNIGSIFHSPFGQTKGLADFVSVVLFNAVALAGVILFLLLVVGGIMMISGAGSGDKESVARGKKAATSALIGFLIISPVETVAKATS